MLGSGLLNWPVVDLFPKALAVEVIRVFMGSFLSLMVVCMGRLLGREGEKGAHDHTSLRRQNTSDTMNEV